MIPDLSQESSFTAGIARRDSSLIRPVLVISLARL